MICRKCSKEIPEGSAFCNHCGSKQMQQPRQQHRRGNGEGTVYKRKSSWYAEKTFDFVVTEDPDNPKKVKTKRIYAVKGGFKTKKEALAYLPLLADPRIKKNLRNKTSQITLKQLYDLWLPTHNASKSTIGCYTAGFKVFEPVWHNRMEDMDIDDLQECMDEFVTKKGSSGKRTLQNARACLGLVYKYGMPRGYVPQNISGEANLAKFLKVNAESGEAKSGFSESELDMIRKSVDDIPYADYILCHCYLGFRPGELLALDAKDYDRKEKSLQGGAKTEAGINRIVTISPKILPIIERLAANKISGPIFCKPDGSSMSTSEYRTAFYSTLNNIGISNAVDQYGVHRLTPHSCRHTFATLMKKVSGSDKDKLEIMGHTSTEMLRYYQDVSVEDLRKITDQI